jgi:hypothetical protein
MGNVVMRYEVWFYEEASGCTFVVVVMDDI